MGSWGKAERQLKVSEVAEILGPKPRQIEGWVEQGFVKPTVPGNGPGRPSYFNYTNLLQGALTLEFQRTFGAKTPVWGRIAGRVAKTLAEESALNRLVMLVAYQEGEPAFIQLTSLDRVDVSVRRELNQGRTVVILGLMGVVKTLHERLAALKPRSAS